MANKKIWELPSWVPSGNTSNNTIPIDNNFFTQKISLSAITEYVQNNIILTGVTFEDITYADLYTAILSETLIPGSWYRLTDYKNVNFLNGWEIANNNPTPVESSFNPREIYEGETEVLLLQAISSSEISPIGYSEDFPQDIVTYLPYVNKIGVNLSIQNGNTLPDSSVVSGFDLQWDGTNVYFNMPTGYPALYGHYFYLSCSFNGGSYYQNGTFEPLSPNGYCQYPGNNNKTISRIRLENGGMKVILIDLEEADFLNYDIGSLVVDHVYALGDTYGWITRRQDTQNRIDVPFDFRNKVYRRYECEILGNINSISYITTGTTATDGIYNNLTPNSSTSTNGQNATFNVTVNGGVVTDVVIKNSGRLYANGDTLTIDGSQINGVSGADDVVITVNGIDSNIGYWGIGDVFNGANTTGNYQDFLSLDWRNYQIYNLEINTQGGADMSYYNGYCENVFLGNVYDCKIGSYFFSNTIGDGFYQNTIGNNFYYNAIGNSFTQNTIGNYFYNNTIGNSFTQNTIGDSFQVNTIGDSFQSNNIGINFTQNTIGYGFTNNTIGNGFNTNTTGVNFQSNNIRNSFGSNTIGDFFTKNTIGDSFQVNNIGDSFQVNNIGNDFNNNTIGNDFTVNTIVNSFQYNNIGDNFNTNIIGDGFYQNTIGNNFYYNAIGNAFTVNTIGNNFYDNAIGNQFSNNTIYNNFTHNKISNEFKGNMMFQPFEGNNVDSFVGGNHFSGATYSNKMGSFTFDNDFLGYVTDNSWKVAFYNNTIENDFINNTIGTNSYSNTIGPNFTNNNIGNNFYENTIGFGFQYNEIGDNFFDNTIDENFGYGISTPQGNKIGNNFLENIIGEYFYNNSIPDNFRNNQVGDYFQWNVIDTNINYVDFTPNYGNITAFTYITLSIYGVPNGIYTNLSGTTNGHGVNATFDIEVSGNTVVSVSGNTSGKLYNINDTITIPGTQIGGVTGFINFLSGYSTNILSVKVYKPADSTYEYPANETEMDYLISNSPLIDTYYSNNIQGVSYSTKTGIGQDNYAMVIEGYIEIPSDNVYYFGLDSDDGSDAFVNGIKVSDWYGAHGNYGPSNSTTYPISLTAGTYSVKVRMQERGGGDIVTLFYGFDGLTWNNIPDSWFKLNTTGITGSYPNIIAQGGNGTNATFDVDVVDGLVASVVLSNGGGSYSVGDVLTIPGGAFGGTEDITITVDSVYSDDVIVTVTGVGPNPSVYETYTCQIFERQGGDKRLSYYDSSDILTIKNINE